MRNAWLAIVLTACGGGGASKAPQMDTFARQLGESTKSPGANASRPAPVTPDDPRVMNVSASITPGQLEAAQAAGAPPQAAPNRADATSSTPITQPTDITPPSTTTEVNRPGLNSPPPQSPSTNPPTPPATAPPGTPAPTTAPTDAPSPPTTAPTGTP